MLSKVSGGIMVFSSAIKKKNPGNYLLRRFVTMLRLSPTTWSRHFFLHYHFKNEASGISFFILKDPWQTSREMGCTQLCKLLACRFYNNPLELQQWQKECTQIASALALPQEHLGWRKMYQQFRNISRHYCTIFFQLFGVCIASLLNWECGSIPH